MNAHFCAVESLFEIRRAPVGVSEVDGLHLEGSKAHSAGGGEKELPRTPKQGQRPSY